MEAPAKYHPDKAERYVPAESVEAMRRILDILANVSLSSSQDIVTALAAIWRVPMDTDQDDK